MSLRLLAGLVGEPRYVDTTDRAHAAGLVHAVPELVDGLPRLDRGGDDRPRVAVQGLGALRGLEGMLADVLEVALAGRPTTTPREDDPLVLAIRRVADATTAGGVQAPGPALVAALLAVQRGCAEAWTTPQGRLAPALAALAARTDASAAVFEAAVAGLQARLSTALVVVARGGGDVPALAQAVVGNRLALVYPAAGMDPWADLGRVLTLVHSTLPVSLANGIAAAVGTVVEGVVDRAAKKKSTAEDQAILLRFLPPDLVRRGGAAAGRIVARDPAAVAFLLPGLGRWTDAKGLLSDKVPAALAGQLLDPAIGVAAAAVWGELLGELRRWEVISALASVVEAAPGQRDEPAEGARSSEAAPRGGAMVPAVAPDVAVAVPAAHPPRTRSAPGAALPERGCVVAVGLGVIRSRVASSPTQAEALEAAWESLASEATAVDLGVVGVLVYADARAALRAALTVAGRFRAAGVKPAVSLGAGTIRSPVLRPGAGIWGGAVEGALRWLAGPGPLPRGVRALRVSEGWLSGAGMGAHRSFIEELERTDGLVTRATVGERLGAAELRLAVELEGAVLIFLPIPGLGGGAELVPLTAQEWQALLGAPAPAAPTPAAPTPIVTGPSAPAPAVTAPMAPPPPPSNVPSPPPAPTLAPVALSTFDSFVAPAVAGSTSRASADDLFAAPPRGGGPTAVSAGPVASGMWGAGLAAPVVGGDPFASASPGSRAAVAGPVGVSDPFTDTRSSSVSELPGAPSSLTPAKEPPAPVSAFAASGDPSDELEFAEIELADFEGPPAPATPSGWTESPSAFDVGSTRGTSDSPNDTPDRELTFAMVDGGGREDDPTLEEPALPPGRALPSSTRDPGASPAARSAAFAGYEDAGAGGPPEGGDAGDDWLNAILDDPLYEVEAPVTQAPSPPAATAAVPASDATPIRATPATATPATATPATATPATATPATATPATASAPAATPPASPPPSWSEGDRSPTPPKAPSAAPRPSPLPPAQPAPSPARPAPARAAPAADAMHLEQVFHGYVVLVAGEEIWFGRPYGARLVDQHGYRSLHDLDEAYRSFLKDKIAEGFVPRTDLTADLPLGATLQPIDAVRLAQAWRAFT